MTINALRMLQSADILRARLSGEFSSVHGISVNEYFMLLHLQKASKRRLTRVELAKRMHVSASTITRMAAPMEKIGLLDRLVDTRDARQAFVVLTDAGESKLEEANATFVKQSGYIFEDRWSNEDSVQFSQYLFRLVSRNPANLT